MTNLVFTIALGPHYKVVKIYAIREDYDDSLVPTYGKL
jgi:hypothetical protein